MADNRVAKRYALALFNQAGSDSEQVNSDLNAVKTALDENQTLRQLLVSPYIERAEKLDAAVKVFSDKVSATTMDFIRLLYTKRRESELEAIVSEYEKLILKANHFVLLEIASAFELSADEKSKVLAKAKTIIGKNIEPIFTVDPTLLGGLRLLYDDVLIDASLRGKLDRLKIQFTTPTL